MGFLASLKAAASKVKKKVKAAVGKADVALGGFIPGGQTPAQVKAAKAPKTETITTKGRRKKDIEVAERPAPRGGAIGMQEQIQGKLEAQQRRDPDVAGLVSQGELAQLHADPSLQISLSDQAAVQARAEAPSNVDLVLAATGAGSLAKWAASSKVASTAGQGLLATAGKNVPTVANAAKGIATNPNLSTNTALASRATSYLWSLVKTLKNPYMTMGAIGGYMFGYNFAYNEKGDALTTLGIAMRDAEKEGDLEAADLLMEQIDEITDPSLWDKLVSFAPYANYLAAARLKAKALKTSSDLIKERMELEGSSGDGEGLTFGEQQILNTLDKRALQLTFRDEDEKYYKNLDDLKRDQSKEDAKEMAAFWNQYAKDKRAQEIKWREEDLAFWKKYADEKKKEYENRQKSQLTFGLL